MFTGIIEQIGRVSRIAPQGGGLRLQVTSPFSQELRVDESVSVSGACQTVVACNAESFEVVAIEETLAKTNLGGLQEGSRVNLERAMKLGDRLDGHLVQGHVDATAPIIGVEKLETSWLFTLRIDPKFASYVIPVGSICLDGISLTVARLSGGELTVAIIPHTWEKTTVSEWRVGGRVNVEFDMVGKYVVGHLNRDR